MSKRKSTVRRWTQTVVLLFMAAIFTTIIFIIDYSTPMHIAIGAMYSLVILYSWVLPGNHTPAYAGLVCSILIIVAAASSTYPEELGRMAGLNAVFSIVVVWVCVSLLTMARRSFSELKSAGKRLEAQVKIRTEQLAGKVLELESQQKKLQNSEARFKELLESAPDAMIIADENLEIILVNGQTEQMFGYRRADLIGKPTEMLIAQQCKKKYNKEIRQFFNSDTTEQKSIELNGITLESMEFPTEISFSPIQTAEGIVMSIAVRDITERKKMEETLELTSDTARVGGWELDLRTNNLTWTRVTGEIHEVPEDYIPSLEEGINFYKEGESRDTIIRVIQDSIENGSAYNVNLQIVTAKGNVRWVRARGQSEFQNGKCIRMYGSFQDIHEEYLKDEKLAISEASLKEAQKMAKVGSWEWIPDTNKVIWSDQMFEILGLPKEEHTGLAEDIFQFVHPEDLDRVRSATKKAIKLKKAIPIAYRIITKKGETKHISSDGESVLDEQGNLKKMHGVLQDVTEQVHRTNEFNAFWTNTLEFMCIIDSNGYFIRLNPKWEEVMGYTEEEFYARPFIDFVHPGDQEATIREVARLSQGEKTIDFINRYQTKSGEYIWLKWSAGFDSDLQCIYATVRDISVEHEYQERLKEHTHTLETKNKELEQFAYITSHDLQEPLRTIIGMSEMLDKKYRGKLDDMADQFLEYILQAGNRMSALIKALLDFSRIGKNRELSSIDCNKLIKEVQDDLQTKIQECDASFEIGKLPQLQGYETELRLLFQNIISNAIKFRKADVVPHIRIQAKKKTENWKFSISDNGIGIAEEHVDRIFAIFQRLHNKNAYEGTGIGLAHCWKIAELHHGRIWVESKLGEGSTFFLTIPTSIADESSKSQST